MEPQLLFQQLLLEVLLVSGVATILFGVIPQPLINFINTYSSFIR